MSSFHVEKLLKEKPWLIQLKYIAAEYWPPAHAKVEKVDLFLLEERPGDWMAPLPGSKLTFDPCVIFSEDGTYIGRAGVRRVKPYKIFGKEFGKEMWGRTNETIGQAIHKYSERAREICAPEPYYVVTIHSRGIAKLPWENQTMVFYKPPEGCTLTQRIATLKREAEAEIEKQFERAS